MGELVKDQIELSQYEEKDVIKVQAFVRGYQGRTRVSLMVQKWIDELLSRKKERENRGNSAKSNTPADISETEHSTSSIGLTDTEPTKTKENNEYEDNQQTEKAPADNKQDSDKKEELKDNNQPTNPDQPPKTEEQKDSKEEEESQEKKDPEEQAPEKQEDTEDESQEKKEEEKTSELTTKGRRNSIVKDFKFQSNATKHVTSSDQLIEEQMVSVLSKHIIYGLVSITYLNQHCPL